jgi:methylamine dehydrogenase accessory protein MauD
VFWASYVVLWVVVVLQGVALLLVLRHFGLAAMSSAMGHTRDGLGVGSRAPDLEGMDRSGRRTRWAADGADAVLYFAAPGCEPCEAMAPLVNDLARRGRGAGLDVVVVAEGGPMENEHVSSLFPSATTVVSEAHDLFDRFLVRVTPFAFLVHEGAVAAKGVCSSPEALAHLLESGGRPDLAATLTPRTSL